MRPAHGVGITFWRSGTLTTVLTPAMKSLISEAQPDILDIHGGPDRLSGAVASVAKQFSQLAPKARIHIGLGWDFWIGEYIDGRVSASKCVDKLCDGADLAMAVGAEAVVHDAEAACKKDSNKTSLIARAVIGRIRYEHPTLLQGFTSYDHPTFHKDDADGVYDDGRVIDEFCWRAFCDDNGVDWFVPQNYSAPEGGVAFAGRGALRARFASSEKSIIRAQTLGWMRQGLPVDTYLQAHHVPFSQTATMGCERQVVKMWAGPRIAEGGRMDESGAWAIKVLCALERAGRRKPGGILALMQEKGLPIDRPYPIAGRQVAAAVGIRVPAGVQ